MSEGANRRARAEARLRDSVADVAENLVLAPVRAELAAYSSLRGAVAALRRWGVLDDVVATGCPPIETYRLDFGPLVLQGSCQPVAGGS